MSLADRMLSPETHLMGAKRIVVYPLRHPQPFDPADHDRRQQAHEELAARLLARRR